MWVYGTHFGVEFTGANANTGLCFPRPFGLRFMGTFHVHSERSPGLKVGFTVTHGQNFGQAPVSERESPGVCFFKERGFSKHTVKTPT